MYKIYINNKPIIIPDNTKDLKPEAGQMTLESPEKEILGEAIARFAYDPTQLVFYLVGKDKEKLFRRFSSLFSFVEAAGGLVQNPQGQYLFIFRRGCWDLPKGKVEKGESIVNTAIREVEEETGISKLDIVRPLNPTFHIYREADVPVLKKTFWFEMKCEIRRTPVPQKSEDIIHAKWLSKKDIKDIVLKNTYASLRDMMEYHFGNFA